MVRRILPLGNIILGGERLTSSSTKMAERINFKLCTHISNRLLYKTVPAFFLIMSYSFFIAITLTSFESIFCMKKVKNRLFKILFEKKQIAGHGFFCLLIGYISVKINYRKLQFYWCRRS